jgi:hypothetical protein
MRARTLASRLAGQPSLFLAALLTLAALAATTTSPRAQGGPASEEGADPKSPPPGLAPHLRESAVLELLERCRWPFPRQADVVWIPAFGAVQTRPARIRLGGRHYLMPLDVMLPGPPRNGLPFEGLIPIPAPEGGAEDRQYFELRLCEGRVSLRVELRDLSERRAGEWAPATPPGPWSILSRAIVDRGVPAGAQTELTLHGLERLLPSGDSTAQDPQAQLHNLLQETLLARFRSLAGEGMQKLPSTAQGIEGLEARSAHSPHAAQVPKPPKTVHTRDLVDALRFGLFERSSGDRIRLGAAPSSTQAETAHRALLERMLRDLRWPVPAAEGLFRLRRLDDGIDRCGMQEHEAFDTGSSYWDARSRRFLCTRAGTATSTPLHGARRVMPPSPGAVAYEWRAQQDGYELRVLAAVWHVDAQGRLSPVDARRPHGGFRSSEPRLRAAGLAKGCHAHVEFVGLFEDQPARRKLFLAQHVGPALWNRPSSAPISGRSDERQEHSWIEVSELRSHIPHLLQGLSDKVQPLPGGRWDGDSLWILAEGGAPTHAQRRGSAWEWRFELGQGRLEALLEPRSSSRGKIGIARGPYRLELRVRGKLPAPIPAPGLARKRFLSELRSLWSWPSLY